jgi:hypothetical protein
MQTARPMLLRCYESTPWRISIISLFLFCGSQLAMSQYGPDSYRLLLREHKSIELPPELDTYLDTAGRIVPCDDCADRSTMVFFVNVLLHTNGDVYRVRARPIPEMSYGVDRDTTMWAWRLGANVIQGAILKWQYFNITDPNYAGPLTFGLLAERKSVIPQLLMDDVKGAHKQELFSYGYLVTLGQPRYELVMKIDVK